MAVNNLGKRKTRKENSNHASKREFNFCALSVIDKPGYSWHPLHHTETATVNSAAKHRWIEGQDAEEARKLCMAADGREACSCASWVHELRCWEFLPVLSFSCCDSCLRVARLKCLLALFLWKVFFSDTKIMGVHSAEICRLLCLSLITSSKFGHLL